MELICKFCGKEGKNSNSHKNHQRLCKNNPDRKYHKGWETISKNKNKKGTNQYIKAKELGLPKPQVSEETREKLRSSGLGRKMSEDWKKKHSEIMKRAVSEHPKSYTASNRGRTKQIEYDGIKFIGKWELDFYLFCKENNILIERNEKWFEYQWNGNRKYFPDFYLPELDLYIEVKGYETDRDRAKWKYFPHKLKVIKKDDIYAIRKKVWQFQVQVLVGAPTFNNRSYRA